MNKLRKLAKSIGEGVTVRDTIEGPVLLFPEKILFDSGMAVIKPGGKGAQEDGRIPFRESIYVYPD